MGDFEEKLNSLLSDPDSMARIVQMAQSLTGGSEIPSPPPPESPPSPAGNGIPDLSGLLGGIDPQILGRLIPLLQLTNTPASGQREQLLLALRPFLSSRRQENIQKALQISRVLHLAKVFFLERKKEDGYV